MTSDEQRRDRAVGAMLGLAIGDAIGTTLEYLNDFAQLVRQLVGQPFAEYRRGCGNTIAFAS
jgi:ADP-ribosylglycohydrolase